jgi:myosin heavy subunit
MDLLRRQVSQARRRLLLQQFLLIAPWCLFGTLLVAAIALAIPKIWVVKVDPQIWLWSWIGGASGVGLVIALIWTYARRRQPIEAALEIDRRFGLKERVSSALTLHPEELDSEAGRALIHDAVQRVEMIVVSEKFQVATGWRPLLPLGTAAAAFVIALLVPNAVDETARAASTAAAQQKQQIKTSAQELQKKLEKKKEEALKQGLQDAEELFKKLTNGIDELHKNDEVDQKKALVKLNDLAKELAQRRDALGDKDKLKQQFEKLKNLEKGPAEKVAEALKEGNFEKAIEKLNELQEKLAKGELTDEEMKQLTQQLEQMKNKMQEMVDAHKEAMKQLEEEIQRKAAEGDREAVNRLQKQLDELKKAERQMNRMESMAKKLDDMQKALKEGDSQKAAAEMAKLQKDLEAMQADQKQMEALQDLMDQLADAKQAMKCESCEGEGCEECQGDGDQFGDMNGATPMDQFGMSPSSNAGRGQGEREEQETKTSSYESRLRATPKGGSAVRVGDAGGPNQSGKSDESISERIESALHKDAEALTDQRLPRTQQDHVKEYYERLRKCE